MEKSEIIELIKNQTIRMPNNGIDNFPGLFISLDTEQISYSNSEKEISEIELMAWTEKGNPRKVNCFVIKLSHIDYIIADHFHEISAVYDYYKKEFKIKY